MIAVDLGLNFVDGDDDWDQYIPMIQHSYNSTPNSMTTYSPNKVIFGKDLEITLDRINNKPLSQHTPDEYVRMMNNKRTIINNEANKHQQRYRKRRTVAYNKNRKDAIKYEVGDAVLVDVSRKLQGNQKSLNPTYIGPYEIVESVDDQQFYLREIDNPSNVTKENIHALKPYKEAPYVMLLQYCHQNESNDPDLYRSVMEYVCRKYERH